MINTENLGPGEAIAGIQSTACECGWECVFVIPEEHERQINAIMTHLREAHRKNLPQFTVTTH